MSDTYEVLAVKWRNKAVEAEGRRYLCLEGGQRKRYGDSFYTFAILADPGSLVVESVKEWARKALNLYMLPAEKPDRQWYQPELLSIRVETVKVDSGGNPWFADRQPRQLWVLRFQRAYDD